MELNSDIKVLKGVGEKTAMLFEKMGISTVKDLLEHYPRDYDAFEKPVSICDVRLGKVVAVEGVIRKNVSISKVRNLQIVTTTIADSTGELAVTWFNMPFLRNTVKAGARFILRGNIGMKNNRLVMEQPVIYSFSEYEDIVGRLQPKYPLVSGLTNNAVTKAQKQLLEEENLLEEYLPEDIRREYDLAEYGDSIKKIHFPKTMDELIKARERIVFDEFLFFIMAIRRLKETGEKIQNSFKLEHKEETDELIKMLPYKLTNAQLNAWKEIEKDMTGPTTMNRLVQGDVGSGKTIVAVLALVMTVACGYQGAFMVPTEVLAKQQCEYMEELFKKYEMPYRCVLLTGSMTAKEKRVAYEKIEMGMVDIVVGTHALIQEKVNYKNLALVVTDEQHRFGVRQRETLANKGQNPHILVMSATPIPRTLAIIIYGDLDISVIDELPAERLPIKNCVVNTSYRPIAYNFIRKQVEEGRQAYIICPMVEESENIEAENVIEYTEQLKSALPQSITVEYLHGKMKPKEKNSIMGRFANNEINVLVSTTVVEVGVNVPNSTVMMIENAERFGLAQLHQLRGRVGRGKYQSFCILINTSDSKEAQKRLEILVKSNDGFFIASEDMKLRGPGDLFGIRQSGSMEFKIGDIYNDAKILQQASEVATELLLNWEQLKENVYAKLDDRLEYYIAKSLGKLSL